MDNKKQETQEDLIWQIQELMGFKIDLSSFQIDDLITTRDDLLSSKENVRSDINQWFDEELCDKLS
jgi:hypothetical protein